MTTEPTSAPPRHGDAARAGIAVLTLILAFAVGQVVALAIIAVLPSGTLPDWATPLLVLLIDLIVLAVVLTVARRLFGQRRPVDFGFRRARPGPATGWTLLALLTMFTVSVMWNTLIRNTDVQDAADLLIRSGVVQQIVAAVVLAVLAPIVEEVLFRGFLFTALRRWIGPWAGAAVAGVLFAMAHIGSSEVAVLLPLAVLGFLACLLFWVTGSLLAPIALHCLQNALAVTGTVGWPLLAAPAVMGLAVLAALLVVGPISTAPAIPSPYEQPQQQPGHHGGGQQ